MSQTKIDVKSNFVRIAHDQAGVAAVICQQLRGSTRRGKFVLCLGGTETSDVPGLSAAGKTPELRRLTPAADAECLILGRVVSVPEVPKSPAGVIAPVVITRACSRLLGWDITVVDCGTFRPPAIDKIQAGTATARCLSSGDALSRESVLRLFEQGLAFGNGIGPEFDYLILGECVPGGTTTALAVLTACGFGVDGLLI
jgi:NaMN:DMB phosphoribosyltransferase